MEVPQFEDKEYDNNKRLREDLTKVLKDFKILISKVEQQFPVGGIAYWVERDSIPQNFEKADGTKGTDDVKDQTIIPIQKIR